MLLEGEKYADHYDGTKKSRRDGRGVKLDATEHYNRPPKTPCARRRRPRPQSAGPLCVLPPRALSLSRLAYYPRVARRAQHRFAIGIHARGSQLSLWRWSLATARECLIMP